MSHFSVPVIVDEEYCSYPEARVEKLLEPYDENGEWFAEGSRWDWWVTGGRYSGLLCNKVSGLWGDIVAKNEIDWEKMGEREAAEWRKSWRDEAARQEPIKKDANGNGVITLPCSGEIVTEDEYVRNNLSAFCTHALVDKDGEWHENGRMGWFGTKIDEGDDDWPSQYRKLLRSVSDESHLAIVDCHV